MMDDLMHDALAHARPEPVSQPAKHPLQPLTAQEISTVVGIIRAECWPAILFETIELLEPPKPLLAAWTPDHTISRAARANVFRLEETGIWRLTVSLDPAA